MPPPDPRADPFANFGQQLVAQFVAAMNNRNERDSAIKMHPVTRHRNGKKVQEASTLPQLLAELNDTLVELINCIDENVDDLLDTMEDSAKNDRKKKRGRRVKAVQDT